MIEYSQSDLFYNSRKLTRQDSVADYVEMGYTPGTAAQLSRMSEHLLRDIGLGDGSNPKL